MEGGVGLRKTREKGQVGGPEIAPGSNDSSQPLKQFQVKPRQESSWIKNAPTTAKAGIQKLSTDKKPQQFLQVKGGLSQASSVPDLTGKSESTRPSKTSKFEDYGSSEQLNVDRIENGQDDDDNEIRVIFPPPKSVPKARAATPQFDSSGIPKGRVTPSPGPFDPKRDQPEEEATGWSLSGQDRATVKSKIADVLGRRAGQSPSPMPVSGSPGPDLDQQPPPPPPPLFKPKPVRIDSSKSKKAPEAVEEPLLKPSRIKATQPKMEDIVGSASSLATKLPKNINKDALLDQFNAMWDTADVMPEIEIVKCGLPETKRPAEAENRTDVEDCIKKLMANDPSLTEININNMKRTPVPQIQRLLEALPYSEHVKVLSMANLGLSDAALTPILEALKQNASLEKLNLETNFLSGDFLVRMFQALLTNQTMQEVKAVNQSVALSNQAELNIMKAIHQNRGLWKVSLNFRLPETRQKVDQALIRNGELRRLKRQIEAMQAQEK